MMNRIYIKNAQKQIKVPDNIRYYIVKCFNNALKYEKFKEDAEVNITFVDENEIKALNKNFRNKDAVTDVLSFPLGENGEYDTNPETDCKMLGDVVICLKRAYEQADSYSFMMTSEAMQEFSSSKRKSQKMPAMGEGRCKKPTASLETGFNHT